MNNSDKLPEYEYSQVPTQELVKEKQEIPSSYGYGVRHIQLLIFLLCMTVNFVARGHMGVTVVAMTSQAKENKTVLDTNANAIRPPIVDKYINIDDIVENNRTIEVINNTEAINKTAEVNSAKTTFRVFPWSKSTQEMVLGAFFLGYCIMTFPMGLVVQRWGGKIPLQIALIVNGIVSILTPVITNWGDWKAVCACRLMQGLSQAGVYPSIQTLLAKWVPASERGALSSYVYTGSTIGTVVAFQLSGLLSASRWGWPSTFWAVGVICLAMFIILTIFGSATPTQHNSIATEEKNFILGRIDDGRIRRQKTPWKAIITSRPMWGILATHIGSGIAFVFFFTQVPSYIHYILGINVKSSGLLSSLPYLASFFTSVSFGVISDYLTNNNILSVKNSRRIFNTISQVGIAVSLICASLTTSTVVVISCLVVAMGCNMAVHVGWMVNYIDLAPNFTGTLMMMGNTLMNIASVLLPVLVSHVVTDVADKMQWRIMIFAVASLALINNFVFILLMSAETQPWNDFEENGECLEHLGVQRCEEMIEPKIRSNGVHNKLLKIYNFFYF